MSDRVLCDGCGKVGKRRIATVAPEGWSYAVFQVEDDPDEELIIWACSFQCRTIQWREGPGKLNIMTGEITHCNV